MNPGPARILTCPYCGAHKEVLSLLSGNTFGQEVWSDNKSIAPMLPRVSFVQKCPSCDGYYLMSRQNPKDGRDISFDTGELSYIELKDAWHSLNDTSHTPELHGWSKLKAAVGLSKSFDTSSDWWWKTNYAHHAGLGVQWRIHTWDRQASSSRGETIHTRHHQQPVRP